MFDSLKTWMTCPFKVKPFKGYTAAADKEFDDAVEMIGYFVGDVTVVTNSLGDDVVSSSQIYYDPSVYTITPLDKVIVDDLEKDIIQITNYMDGNFGESSIKIVYL